MPTVMALFPPPSSTTKTFYIHGPHEWGGVVIIRLPTENQPVSYRTVVLYSRDLGVASIIEGRIENYHVIYLKF